MDTTSFIVYNNNTGEIIRWGWCSIGDANLQVQENSEERLLIGIADNKLKYVVNNELVDRPSMGVSIDTITVIEGRIITITGVPTGADIWVDGEKFNLAVGETVLELSFDVEGKYQIRINSFPYQDWERTVTVI